MKKYLLPALVVLVVVAGAVWAGRVWQSRRDVAASDRAVALANQRADSAAKASQAQVDSARVAQMMAKAEATRLRKQAQAHALADRQQDSALAAAQTAGDSLPIVVTQRDQARAAYAAELASGDSLQAALVQADTILAATKRGHTKALDAMREDLRGMALRLEQASLKKKFLGFLPQPVCVVGYGVQGETRTPVRITHGAQITCGFKVVGR